MIVKLDILLHESGHLMLSDFDLSIQSPTAAPPTLVRQNSPFSVSRVLCYWCSRVLN